MSNVEAVSSFRKRRKENLIRLCGGKCSLCGYNKCIGALEFHHINPKDKSFGISTGNCHKIEDDIAEVKKCLLLCANCHREIHNGFYENVNLFQFQKIDKDYEQELLSLNKKEKIYCKDCGKEITIYSKSGYCKACSIKYKTKVQNKPDRETLKALIRTLPFVKIAEQYNVSDNAIRKWCDKFDLPRTKKSINNFTEEQWAKI